MKKLKFILAFLLTWSNAVVAQDLFLELSKECKKDIESPFSTVHVIDNRLGKELIGYVNTGMSNKVKTVKYAGELADSLADFFSSGKSGGKNVVFMLNEFFMHESDTGPGRLKISLRLFSEETTGRFREFLTIDTVYRPRGIDVTKRLLRTVSEQFCAITREASQTIVTPNQDKTVYSLNDLFRLDSLEKIHIPMYVTDKPKSGIYKDYAHFKMNMPDISTEIVIDTSKTKNIKIYRVYKAKNRKIPLDHEGVYAVSDGHKIFKVSGDGEYFEIKKLGFDFFYERSGSFAPQPGNTIPVYIYPGGAIAGAIAGAVVVGINAATAQNTSHRYMFMINHRKGNSVPVSVIGK